MEAARVLSEQMAKEIHGEKTTDRGLELGPPHGCDLAAPFGRGRAWRHDVDASGDDPLLRHNTRSKSMPGADVDKQWQQSQHFH
eukprot:scaffold99750_cov16-Prasinocladus_malaysianus.AAC.1